MRHGPGEDVATADYRNARDVVFLKLRDTVFCSECELISYNHSPQCLACGSSAVLSLSRILGGSLRGQETARLVTPEVVDTVVGQVLAGTAFRDEDCTDGPTAAIGHSTSRDWPGNESCTVLDRTPVGTLEIGTRRCRELTNAAGAAVAIVEGRRVICRGRAGSMAPDLGAEASQESLTALCLRTGQLWRCDDTEREPWAAHEVCRALGIRSLVIAPMLLPQRVIGVLEVFSSLPFAFDDAHSATVQLFAGALTVALLRHTSQQNTLQPRALALDE